MSRYTEPIWPKTVLTLGAMRGAQVPLKAFCSRCREFFPIDLDRMIELHGPDYCLIGKRGQCKTSGCGGSCAFLYQRGAGVPFRKLG